jgi:hypothetical protein
MTTPNEPVLPPLDEQIESYVKLFYTTRDKTLSTQEAVRATVITALRNLQQARAENAELLEALHGANRSVCAQTDEITRLNEQVAAQAEHIQRNAREYGAIAHDLAGDAVAAESQLAEQVAAARDAAIEEVAQMVDARWYGNYAPLVARDIRALLSSPPAPSQESGPHCQDCNRPYPHGLDMVLTRKQWEMIQPQPEWELCPSCIVNRAAKLEGAVSVYAVIMFANSYEDAAGVLIRQLRLENSDYRNELTVAQYKVEKLTEALHAFCSTLAFTPSSVPGAIEHDLNAAYELSRKLLALTPEQWAQAAREGGKG